MRTKVNLAWFIAHARGELGMFRLLVRVVASGMSVMRERTGPFSARGLVSVCDPFELVNHFLQCLEERDIVHSGVARLKTVHFRLLH